MTRRCLYADCDAEPVVTITVRAWPTDSWLGWLIARFTFTRRRGCAEHVIALADEMREAVR